MIKVKCLIFFIFILVPAMVFAQDKTSTDLTSISSQEFNGFDKCNISKKLSDTMGRFIAAGKPVKKEKDTWTFAIKSEVMGMPVEAIEIGVCDSSGSQSCGWGSYFAVVVKKNLNEAKSHLKKKTGIDFTKEKRSEDTEVTLRPILKAGKKSDESILFCDPGTL